MKKNEQGRDTTPKKIVLTLYVSGMSQKSMEAIENIRRICDEHFKDQAQLNIIDIYKNPESAREQHIVFSPSLIRTYPEPKKILIGTLSDTEKVMRVLGVQQK